MSPDERAEYAWDEWAEEGPAREQYDSDLSDGIIPCERYTRDGVGINPQPFDDWIHGEIASSYFETWFNEEADPR